MHWPLVDSSRRTQGGALTASSLLTTITANATVHTKGSWTELVSSVPFPGTGIWIHLGPGPSASGVDTSTLVDIGVGASGSEVVLIPNLAIGGLLVTGFFFPVQIPNGARISARAQSAVASKTFGMQVFVQGGGMLPPDVGHRVTAYGPSTSTSNGVELTVPGTINTKNSTYNEITASTTNRMRFLVIDITGRGSTVQQAADVLVDIAAGASGSEVDIIQNLHVDTSTAEFVRNGPLTIPAQLPAGTRLSARMQATNAASSATVAVSLYGVD